MKNINRSYAVYFSATGHSKTGAESVAKKLCSDMKSIDLTRFDAEPEISEFSEDDVVVFGAPVYGGRIYCGAGERFRKLKGHNTPCIVTVTYGNRDFDDALLELADLAIEQGFVPFAGAALVSEHTFGDIQRGRPDASDIEQNEEFAAKALNKLQNSDLSVPAYPGKRPYCKGGNGGKFHPQTDAGLCRKCGLCARKCPVGAISSDDFTVDPEKCISCFRCIKNCPVHAKNMDTPEYNEFAAAFSKKLSARCENRYFL